MNTRRAYSDGDRGHDDARSETMTNATMTASLTPAVMPARRARDLPVALGLGNDLPSACSRFCVGLAGWAFGRGYRIERRRNQSPARPFGDIPSPQSRHSGYGSGGRFVGRSHDHGRRAELPCC